MEPVVAGHPGVRLERGEQLEPCRWAAHHRHGDGPIEGHHRVRGDRLERLVQHEDLGPVRVLGAPCLVMDCRDCRLELVGPGRSPGEGRRDQRRSLVDHRPVPAAAVLAVERHEAAVGPGASRPPRIREQHQREQPADLGVDGQHAMDVACEADGLRGEIRPLQVGSGRRRVALVEDQVQHLQDHLQPSRQLGCRVAARTALRRRESSVSPG